MSLTDGQRDILRRLLQEERSRALAMLNRDLAEVQDAPAQDRSGDLSAVPLHPADLGTDTMDAELQAANESRVSAELAEIDAALERLYSAPELFGICDDTGKQIPFERLRLVPWARTCGEAGAP